MRIEIVLGDITLESADVIVSSASPGLAGAEGVEGAIRRHAGAEVLDECRRHWLATGGASPPSATVTPTSAGTLSARWLFHATGPSFGRDAAPVELARCYMEAIRLAEQLGARSLAFPAISTGRRGFPVDTAATIAMRAVRYADSHVETVRFVLHDKPAYRAFVDAFVAAL